MNIVVHCIYFPPEVGGLESHVHHLCRRLAAMGHDVSVVTSLSRPGLPEREDMDGIQVHRTPMPSRTPTGWFAHAVGSTRRTRVVAERADVVHAQAFPSILPCALALAGRSCPLVATLHTSHFLRLCERPAARWPLGRLVGLADHCFAASRQIAQVGEALGSSLRVEALTNGVETSVFRPRGAEEGGRASAVGRAEPGPSGGASTVGPAGPGPGGELDLFGSPAAPRRLVVPRRLFPKNGVEYFVRALPTIFARFDARAVVIGDGPERPRLEALARELGVADRIDFLGARPHGEMPDLLAGSDLAVFPSLMEATSVAALEAMACGVPVAASRVGGLPEIVDDRVGGLFPPRDPERLAGTVIGLLADPGLAARGVRARARVVKHWSNARLAERHVAVYEALLAGRDR